MSKNVGIEPKNDTLEGFERVYEYIICLHRQHLPLADGCGADE